MAESALIRRILVGLDASQTNAAVLHTAVHLSALLEADITGLFVEDMNLIRLAQLPFSREIRYLPANARPLHHEQIQQLLRTHATWLQHEFRQTAANRAVKGSFNVVRGFVTQELLAAAEKVDLLVIGRLSHQRGFRKQVGSTTLTAVQQAATSVLVVSPEIDLNRPVAILYDDSPSADYALAVALALAQMSRQLIVFIWAQDEQKAKQMELDIQTAVTDDTISYTYRRWLPGQNPAEWWAEQPPGIVVVSNGRNDLPASVTNQLLYSATFPVLFVRQPHLHPV